ncbi:MAG: DotA/TraY family protein [Pseudomonadota bacterium]|nr:DotA/TraY family protein [Pseudomonadota bacterium]
MKNALKTTLLTFLILISPLVYAETQQNEVLSDAQAVVNQLNQDMSAASETSEEVNTFDFSLIKGVLTEDDAILNMMKRLIGQPINEIKNSALGGEGSSSAGSGTTAITKTIVLLSTLATFIVALIILYIFSVAIFQQARTGTFLGDKWDSWGVPLRIALSNAMLIPIPKFGGLNGAQVLITVIFLTSLAMANFMASKIVEYSFSEKLIAPLPTSSNSSVAVNIIKNRLCMAVYNDNQPANLSISYGEPESESPFNIFSWFSSEKSYSTSLNYGRKKECGSVVVKKEYDEDKSLDKETFDKLIAILPDALKKLDRDLAPVATDIFRVLYKDQSPSPAFLNAKPTIEAALVAFNSSIASSVTLEQEGFEDQSFIKAKELIDRGGFALLGAFYWAIVDRQAIITENYYQNTNTENYIFFESLDEDAHTEERIEEINELNREAIQVATVLAPGELSKDIDYYTKDKSIMQHIQGAYMNTFEWLFLVKRGEEIDPMLSIRHMGNTILVTSFAFNSTLAWLKATADGAEAAGKSIPFLGAVAAGGGGFFSSLIGSLMNTFATALNVMYAIGLIMAVLIPMMPFILLTFGVIGLLIYYMEALAGSTFWMAIHAHPEGHEIYGKAGQGYGILYTLLTRAVLMVVGFTIGMGIFRVGSEFFMSIFSSAFMWGTDEGTSLGIGTAIGYPIVLTGTLLALAYKSFQLSYEFPNFVNRWNGMTDHNDMGEIDAKTLVAGMYAGQGGAQIGQSLGQGVGQDKKKDDKQNNNETPPQQGSLPPKPKAKDRLLRSAKSSSNRF